MLVENALINSAVRLRRKAVNSQGYKHVVDITKDAGKTKQKSTGTALAHFTDNILQNMDAGSFVGAVFLHLSKAFDTVDHHLLLRKLMNSVLPVLPPSGLDRMSQTDHKSHRLEMLILQLPTCLSGYAKTVYWGLYCF